MKISTISDDSVFDDEESSFIFSLSEDDLVDMGIVGKKELVMATPFKNNLIESIIPEIQMIKELKFKKDHVYQNPKQKYEKNKAHQLYNKGTKIFIDPNASSRAPVVNKEKVVRKSQPLGFLHFLKEKTSSEESDDLMIIQKEIIKSKNSDGMSDNIYMSIQGSFEIEIKKRWERRFITQKESVLYFHLKDSGPHVEELDMCNVYKLKKCNNEKLKQKFFSKNKKNLPPEIYFEITVKTPHKKWKFRCKTSKERDSWFSVFEYFLNNYYNYQSLSLNPRLISNYIKNLFHKTNASNLRECIDALAIIESWFLSFQSMNKKLPYDFKTDFFCNGLEVIFSLEHHTTILAVLKLLYNYSGLFKGIIREKVFIHFLVFKHFSTFFLSWNSDIRKYYMKLMLYKGIEQPLSSIESLLNPKQKSSNASDWLHNRIDMNLYLILTQYIEGLKHLSSPPSNKENIQTKSKEIKLKYFNFEKNKLQKLNDRKKKFIKSALSDWELELKLYNRWENKTEVKSMPDLPNPRLLQYNKDI